MKRIMFFMLLLLVSFVKAGASITINVDKASNVKATVQMYTDVELVDGENVFDYDASSSPLSIEPANGAEIVSVTMNGTSVNPGYGGVYRMGIEDGMVVNIITSGGGQGDETKSMVSFNVDIPSRVKVHLEGSDDLLDVAKTYEFENGDQIIIEPSSDEVRIESVSVSGLVFLPMADGSYSISVTSDMTIDIKTKSIQPYLTFNVDEPKRIVVMEDGKTVDILGSGPIEVRKGASISVKAAADNFSIVRLSVDGSTIEPVEGVYTFVVEADATVDVVTTANLKLYIDDKIIGGIVVVKRGEETLKSGDSVADGDVLQLEAQENDGYVFEYFTLNGVETQSYVTVGGADDIVIGASFRKIKDGYALIKWNINSSLVDISQYDSEGIYISSVSDTSEPVEFKKGSVLKFSIWGSSRRIKTSTVNGNDMAVDENGDRWFTVTENATVCIEVERLINVSTYDTRDEEYKKIGNVVVVYEGKEYPYGTYIPVGATVTFVAKPEPGYKLDYLYFIETPDIPMDGTYTATQEDIDAEKYIIVQGKFIVDNGTGIGNVENPSGLSYDIEGGVLSVASGSSIQVYTTGGHLVRSGINGNVTVSSLPVGIYIVKSAGRTFKFVKN